MNTDVLIIGGSLGGIAAALAAARMGRNVIVTEETAWIGVGVTHRGILAGRTERLTEDRG